MNEKLSFLNISEALAQKAGVQKKVSETFTKAFFDAIVEALYMGEDTIKVKGLGTFKQVEVGSRESVNVSNGERIVILGYKKVSFTPEDSVVEFLNSKDFVDEQLSDTEVEPVEDVVDIEDVSPVPEIAEMPNELDDLLQVVVPERVETLQDEFAGIDMLISTPESVEEVRQQLADAVAKMEEAVDVARKAMGEKLRLQTLLERLETNAMPEIVEADSVSEYEKVAGTDATHVADTALLVAGEESTEAIVSETSMENADEATKEGRIEPLSAAQQDLSCDEEEERKKRAFERVMRQPNEPEVNNVSNRKRDKGVAWFFSIIAILLVVIVFFLYRTFVSIDAVKDVAPLNESTKPKVEHPKEKETHTNVKKSDTQRASEVKDASSDLPSATKEETPLKSEAVATDAAPQRPSIYVIKKGESLTRISQRFYGTKDSVRAIIRVNDFIDPDNVPIGAKIKLP